MSETVVGVGADLLSWEALAALPDLVSLAELQPSNNATVVSREPFQLCLPAKRWANGALLPVHCPESWPDGRRALVRLGLAVNCGRIGVAGVDASLEQQTTPEREVHVGLEEVELSIDPQTTRWIVLRTTSADGQAPKVTVNDVLAHIGGTARVRVHPGPEPDLVVVLSPGKTATISAEKTIAAAYPSLPVRRTHFLSAEALAGVEHRAQDASNPKGTRASFQQQAEHARTIRREVDSVAAAGGKIGYVCGCREPLDRTVSARFQTLEHYVPSLLESHSSGPEFVDALIAGLQASLREHAGFDPLPGEEPEWTWLWRGVVANMQLSSHVYSREIPRVTGIDPLAVPFDWERGYALAEQGNAFLLLYRFEDLPDGLAAGLSALLSRPIATVERENRSVDKPLAGVYRAFRERLRVPREVAERIYDTNPIVRHFYSEGEIATFIRKWSM